MTSDAFITSTVLRETCILLLLTETGVGRENSVKHVYYCS